MIRALLVAAAIGAAAVGAAPVAFADPPYDKCKDAAADGRFNIPSDDPAYGDWLDSDHDGIACEKKN
jgi:hypothetical protein